MTDPVEDQFIEYTYTSYKIPRFTDTSEVPLILPTYADAIAKKLYPELSDTEANGLPKAFGTIRNGEKAYIFGFVGKKVNNIIAEMYFVTIWYEGTDENNKQQINCYKCDIGKTNKCGFINVVDTVSDASNLIFESGIEVREDTFNAHLFGFHTETVDDAKRKMFYLPPHSFFLEGEHQEFSDLPAGSYGGQNFYGK